MSRSARFRELLKTPPFICMGAHDAVTAKLAEQAGAAAIYVSGFAASAIVAGQPDFGVLSQTEMFEHIRRDLPGHDDSGLCRCGYRLWRRARRPAHHGSVGRVRRIGAASGRSGGAEECGHFAGKQLVPPEEMRQKLRAMLEARRDPDFFIVARTDAVAVTGLDDAIARLKSYAAVGADGLYVDAPESVEQLREISRQLKPLGKPLLFNMARSGKSPYLSLKEVYELGFDYALCPIEPMFAMHKAVKEMMEIMLREGSTNAIADRLTSFEDFNNFVGLPEVVAREKRFAS